MDRKTLYRRDLEVLRKKFSDVFSKEAMEENARLDKEIKEKQERMSVENIKALMLARREGKKD